MTPSIVSEWANAPVRPLVTVMFSVTLCYGFFNDKVTTEAFIGIVGAVIGFWFNRRDEEKREPIKTQ